MTFFVRKTLPDRFKDFLAEVAAPRVVERERALLERVEHELGVLAARLEAVVRERDGELRLLDSPELRLALGDLRERTSLFFRALERDALGVEGLLSFIDTVTRVGVADVKTAESVEEVADAVSRAVDHVQDYMIGHGILDPDALTSGRLVRPHVVRKVRSRTVGDASAWRLLMSDRLAGSTRAVGIGGSDRATLA